MSENMINIVIADDHPAVRAGIKSIIQSAKLYSVTGEASNAEALFELLQKNQYSIVILDIEMPGMNGIDALVRIKKEFPNIKVILYSFHSDKETFTSALTKGVDGFVVKNEEAEILLTVMDLVSKGEKGFSPEFSEFIKDSSFQRTEKKDYLTKREKEILNYLVKGYSNKEVANLLSVSVRTVEFHKQNLKDKLNVKNLAEMIEKASKLNL